MKVNEIGFIICFENLEAGINVYKHEADILASPINSQYGSNKTNISLGILDGIDNSQKCASNFNIVSYLRQWNQYTQNMIWASYFQKGRLLITICCIILTSLWCLSVRKSFDGISFNGTS